MAKHLVLMTIVIFGYLLSLSAQENIQEGICDISWWQQITIEDVRILLINNSDFDNLKCNESGDTPLMIAIRSGVSFDVLMSVLELIGYNAIAKSLNVKNNFEDSALRLLLEKPGDLTSHLDINVKIDLEGISKAELPN